MYMAYLPINSADLYDRSVAQLRPLLVTPG